MIGGYEKPLHILPFVHRYSHITSVFHWQEPLTPDQAGEAVASKPRIYDGFKALVEDCARIVDAVQRWPAHDGRLHRPWLPSGPASRHRRMAKRFREWTAIFEHASVR